MLKSGTFPLDPRGGVSGLLALVRRALVMKAVQRVEVTPAGVTVSRDVEDPEEEVVLPGHQDIDIVMLVERLEMVSQSFDAKEHGTHALHRACLEVYKRNRRPRAVVAPSQLLLMAWLGFEEMDPPPKTLYGMHLIIAPPQATNGRILVLGAKPYLEYLSDVDMAIVLDMGV